MIYKEISKIKKSRYNEYDQDMLVPDDRYLQKFANQKYFLFSKFDKGLKFDYENWFSVTPEPVAKFIASFLDHMANVIVIDCCCGNGGNLIQFALHKNVKMCFGVDTDQVKIQNASHNASKYAANNITLFCQPIQNFDFNKVKESQGNLVLFFDPPWGGGDYQIKDQVSLKDFDLFAQQNIVNNERLLDEQFLIQIFLQTSNLILKLPKNLDIHKTIDELQNAFSFNYPCQKFCVQVTKILENNWLKYFIIQTGIDLIQTVFVRETEKEYQEILKRNEKDHNEAHHQQFQNQDQDDEEYEIEFIKCKKKY